MIRTNTKHTGTKQAYAVQQRRVNAGKFGYAKAVRRFLRREVLADDYQKARALLPVLWSENV